MKLQCELTEYEVDLKDSQNANILVQAINPPVKLGPNSFVDEPENTNSSRYPRTKDNDTKILSQTNEWSIKNIR